MPQTDLDLDRLRSDMMNYMRQTGLPVFYAAGDPDDDEDYTLWAQNAFPDWRQFVDVAKESGARMLVFSWLSLGEEDVDLALEKLGECDMERDERSFFTQQFESLRRRVGQTAWVRIAFEHGGRWMAYELSVPWHDEFRSALEDLDVYLPLAEEDEEESGGLFSRN